MKKIDLTGKRFGRLEALSSSKRGTVTYWNCKCDCGTQTDVSMYSLTSGCTKSCGCLRADTNSSKKTKHGAYGTPEYVAWRAMWSRCTNPNNAGYRLYKDKAPPDEWKDFNVFLACVGLKPSKKHSIDRIDSTKPYGPGNTRWATALEQGRNTSRVIRVVMDGVEMPFSEACQILGFVRKTIYRRFVRSKDMLKASEGNFYIKE